MVLLRLRGCAAIAAALRCIAIMLLVSVHCIIVLSVGRCIARRRHCSAITLQGQCNANALPLHAQPAAIAVA